MEEYKSSSYFAGLSFAQISPLEKQAVELGVCPKCHTKTMTHIITNEIGKTYQCSDCLNVYILDE